jgi:ethanolamine utilization cobalamin adenosyltransferase
MERKKIVPKNKFNASQQEELLEKLQRNQENTVNVQTVTAVAVKEPEPIVVVQEETVILQQKPAIAVKSSKDTVVVEKTGKIQRITVDMPLELYERMKDEVDDNGQTIKGFVVNLVKSHFSKK